MNYRLCAFAVLSLSLLLASPHAVAHPHEQSATEQQNHVEQEVVVVRERIRTAVQSRDAVALRAIFAASFTHTHGSGKVDGRDARIVSLLTGEPVIELAPVEELTIRIPNADTAVVSGRSPILNKQEGRLYDFRWLQVYARVGGDWQLMASQATRLGPTV